MNLIIFDFDNTLFPTNYLLTGNTISSHQVRMLHHMVNKLLNIARMYGQVVVITTSQTSWVPRINSSVSYNFTDIDIIAAEGPFKCSEDVFLWKSRAFKKYKNLFTRIISIGDSNAERQALLSNIRNGVSVKLQENPDVHTLLQEIIILIENFSQLFTENISRDLFIELPKQASSGKSHTSGES